MTHQEGCMLHLITCTIHYNTNKDDVVTYIKLSKVKKKLFVPKYPSMTLMWLWLGCYYRPIYQSIDCKNVITDIDSV